MAGDAATSGLRLDARQAESTLTPDS